MSSTGPGQMFSVARPTGPLTSLRRLAVVAFVGFCLAGGSYLRFHNIGKFGFWTDEFFHVFAAQSYLKDGSLKVPMHGEYTRAEPITYITAWSFKHFGVSETSARAPFAATNVLFIVVAFFLIRRLFGLLPALATLGVLSFAPFMIHMSRECRMYTIFQLLYFSWQATFLLGFEPRRRRPGWEGVLDIDARWLTISVILLPMAIVMHDLAWNGGLVIAAYLGLMFIWEAWSKGSSAALTSKYGAGLAAVIAAVAAMFVFRRDDLRDMIQSSQEVPEWAVLGKSATNFYRYLLSDMYPALFFAYPLAAFSFIRAHRRRGLFVVIGFSLLFVLHSYVFGRKGDRYIFYIFPFFVLVSASLISRIVIALARELRTGVAGASVWVKAAGWFCAVPAMYLVAYPWAMNALRQPNTFAEIDWKAAAAEVRQKTTGETVIGTSPMPYLYYMGTLPDYYMLGEIWDVNAHAGRLVRSANDLRAVLDKPGLAIVVTDRGRIGNRAFITPDMEEILKARTRLEISDVDSRIRYYEELPAPTAPKR